jgi:hypothetical protein
MTTRDSHRAVGAVAGGEPLFCDVGIRMMMPDEVDQPKGNKSSAGGSKAKRDGNRRKRNKGRS